MSDYRRARVYVQGIPAAILEETEDGYVFSYEKQYVEQYGEMAVSLTLPVREEAYRSGVLFPFFDGLIPEGWLLNVVCHNWKLNQNDRFGLLLHACQDCIGDVTVQELPQE